MLDTYKKDNKNIKIKKKKPRQTVFDGRAANSQYQRKLGTAEVISYEFNCDAIYNDIITF
ncbi:hypothetical protein bcgnr5382_51100 [Bacillus cereus]